MSQTTAVTSHVGRRIRRDSARLTRGWKFRQQPLPETKPVRVRGARRRKSSNSRNPIGRRKPRALGKNGRDGLKQNLIKRTRPRPVHQLHEQNRDDPPSRARRASLRSCRPRPSAKINTKTYCHASPTTLSRGPIATGDRQSPVPASWSSTAPHANAITIPPAMKPMISAERGGRVIYRLLSILVGRCKRIVRLHHQIAQKLVRRIDRCRDPEMKAFCPVFFRMRLSPNW